MNNLNIVILDSATLGSDIEFSKFEKLGRVSVYDVTAQEDVCTRVADADVIIVNKIKLNESNLSDANQLKLICVTATGYDNIDVEYCKKRGIGVCNVRGYSSDSVAQTTVAMALSLVNNISFFDRYVKNGSYTNSGTQNRVEPVFHEMTTMTWGIVGLGGIGKRTAEIAKALGCRIIAFKRTPKEGYDCVDIDTLCEESDIISVHLPLTDETRCIINKDRIAKMKDTAIVINVARGAVVDEMALADAVISGKLGGLGVDVYSYEPMPSESPYNRIAECDNVILTPHMAWGAYEARVRCMDEIFENINAFYGGEVRNRVDIG